MGCVTERPTTYIYVMDAYYSCTRDGSLWSSRSINLSGKEPLTIYSRMVVSTFIIFSVKTKWRLALVAECTHSPDEVLNEKFPRGAFIPQRQYRRD